MDENTPVPQSQEVRPSATLRVAGLVLVGMGLYQAVFFSVSWAGTDDLPQRMRAPMQWLSVVVSALTIIVGVGVLRRNNVCRASAMTLAALVILGSVPPRNSAMVVQVIIGAFVWFVLHQRRSEFPTKGFALGLWGTLAFMAFMALGVMWAAVQAA